MKLADIFDRRAWENPPCPRPQDRTPEQRTLDAWYSWPVLGSDGIAFDWIHAALGEPGVPREVRILHAKQICSQYAYRHSCDAVSSASIRRDIPFFWGDDARVKCDMVHDRAMRQLNWHRSVMALLEKMQRQDNAAP